MDWTVRTWDWLIDVGYIDKDYNVYDGAHIGNNCSVIVKQQFSYNAAVLLQGAAFLWNQVSLTIEHDTNIITITPFYRSSFFPSLYLFSFS